ncbi:hypothetical protein [Chondrinema litorale]|uniref:hypothetical protein n=1 Tax=Chondrinema litorale TaxID=2994555 RepID=UPI00254315D4|nr:hypothetical protein [Chondrinema litorale]UZR93143.1 hypothetical protein OQ292_14885 [Chondrinema litorale]
MSQPVINLSKSSLKISDNLLGGLVNSIKIVLPEEVDSFPEVDGIQLSGVITFKEDGGYRDWYHTSKTGIVESEVTGSQGGQVFKNRIAFTVPSNQPEVLLNVMSMLNRRVIAIGKDTLGRYRVVGSPTRPAIVRSTTKSGKNRSDRAGSDFVIECYASLPALVYTDGNPINYDPGTGEPIVRDILPLSNGLYFDTNSQTGKLGGSLIENTFIYVQPEYTFEISNRNEGYVPPTLKHREGFIVKDDGAYMYSTNAHGTSALYFYDQVLEFKTGPGGTLKYDDPHPYGHDPLDIFILGSYVAPVQWVKDYVAIKLEDTMGTFIPNSVIFAYADGKAMGDGQLTYDHLRSRLAIGKSYPDYTLDVIVDTNHDGIVITRIDTDGDPINAQQVRIFSSFATGGYIELFDQNENELIRLAGGENNYIGNQISINQVNAAEQALDVLGAVRIRTDADYLTGSPVDAFDLISKDYDGDGSASPVFITEDLVEIDLRKIYDFTNRTFSPGSIIFADVDGSLIDGNIFVLDDHSISINSSTDQDAHLYINQAGGLDGKKALVITGSTAGNSKNLIEIYSNTDLIYSFSRTGSLNGNISVAKKLGLPTENSVYRIAVKGAPTFIDDSLFEFASGSLGGGTSVQCALKFNYLGQYYSGAITRTSYQYNNTPVFETNIENGADLEKLGFVEKVHNDVDGLALFGIKRKTGYEIYAIDTPTNGVENGFILYAADYDGDGTASPSFLTEDGIEIDLRELDNYIKKSYSPNVIPYADVDGKMTENSKVNFVYIEPGKYRVESAWYTTGYPNKGITFDAANKTGLFTEIDISNPFVTQPRIESRISFNQGQIKFGRYGTVTTDPERYWSDSLIASMKSFNTAGSQAHKFGMIFHNVDGYFHRTDNGLEIHFSTAEATDTLDNIGRETMAYKLARNGAYFRTFLTPEAANYADTVLFYTADHDSDGSASPYFRTEDGIILDLRSLHESVNNFTPGSLLFADVDGTLSEDTTLFYNANDQILSIGHSGTDVIRRAGLQIFYSDSSYGTSRQLEQAALYIQNDYTNSGDHTLIASATGYSPSGSFVVYENANGIFVASHTNSRTISLGRENSNLVTVTNTGSFQGVSLAKTAYLGDASVTKGRVVVNRNGAYLYVGWENSNHQAGIFINHWANDKAQLVLQTSLEPNYIDNNTIQVWSQDYDETGDNACFHTKTEDNKIIKLYQLSAIDDANGTNNTTVLQALLDGLRSLGFVAAT